MDVCRPCHFAWRLAFALRCAVFSQSKSSDIGNINSCFAAYIHAWLGSDIFLIHAMPIFHYGTWVTVPWLLWLSVCILGENNNSEKRPYRFAVGLFILLAVVTLLIFQYCLGLLRPLLLRCYCYMCRAQIKKVMRYAEIFTGRYWFRLFIRFPLGRVDIGGTEMVAHDRILSGFSLKYLTYTIENVLVFMGKLGWRHPSPRLFGLLLCFYFVKNVFRAFSLAQI